MESFVLQQLSLTAAEVQQRRRPFVPPACDPISARFLASPEHLCSVLATDAVTKEQQRAVLLRDPWAVLLLFHPESAVASVWQDPPAAIKDKVLCVLVISSQCCLLVLIFIY